MLFMQLLILIIGFALTFFHPIDADQSNQTAYDQSNDNFTGICWVGNKRDGYKEQICPVGQICSTIGCWYKGGLGKRYLKNCTSEGSFCELELCEALIGEKNIHVSSCLACKDKDLCNNEKDEGEDPPFNGECWVGNKRDGYKAHKCSTGQSCESIGCKYDGGTRFLKSCVSGAGCKNYNELCKLFLGNTNIDSSSSCSICNEKDLCNGDMDEGEDPQVPTVEPTKCWKGNGKEGYFEQKCLAGQFCYSIGCKYGEYGGTRYIKDCVASHKDVCDNADGKCKTFLPETKFIDANCHTCKGTDLCNDQKDEGGTPSSKEKFTGKCWFGNKEEGYSEYTCPAGQSCYSIGCKYDGGIRYIKGCATTEDVCLFLNVECMPWMYYFGASENVVIRQTCNRCNDKDLCNDEKDEGELPDIVTLGSWNGDGLKCNLIAAPGFPLKEKIQICNPNKKQTHCMIMDYCYNNRVMTVGTCYDEYICDNSQTRRFKDHCENLLGKPISCRTCNTDFCNWWEGGKSNSLAGDVSGSNNGSDGLDGGILMVVTATVVVSMLISF